MQVFNIKARDPKPDGAAGIIRAERGLPGPGTQQPIGERQWDQHLRFWTSHKQSIKNGSFHLSGLVQGGSLRYMNPRLALDQTGQTWTGSLDAELRTTWRKNFLLMGGLTTGYGHAAHPNLSDDASELNLGAFLNTTLDFNHLLLYPAIRFDVYDVAGAQTTSLNPRMALNVQPFHYDRLRIKTSLSRSFRVPTFNDRFWQPGGNPNLKPEHGWTIDAGLYFMYRQHEFEVTAYTSTIQDQIVWQPQASFWAPANVSNVRSRGIETSYTIRGIEGPFSWNAGLLYTLTHATDRSDPSSPSFEQQLRYIPLHQLKSFAGARWGDLALDLTSRYIGTRFVTIDGHQSLEPYFALDAQIGYHLPTQFATASFNLVVENVLDRAYTVIKDYPMPPRHIRVRLVLQTP